MTTRTAEREQFLADIIITAVEGGTGYWAAVSGYVWCDAEEGERAANTKATLHELDDATGAFDGDTHDLTIETVAAGIGKIKRGEVGVRADLLEAIKRGDAENDAGDIDADCADVIVQAGLFGEVVYG